MSVLAANEELSGSEGNVFSIAGSWVDVRWQSDGVMSVQYSGRVLRQRKRVRDIRVDYLPTGIM